MAADTAAGNIVLYFFLFSFAGWIYESTFVSIRDKKLTNRGFLVGPWIPIYGIGAVVLWLTLQPFSGIPTVLYLSGMLIASVIEYVTAWFLEKLFHTKWWDYSEEPYNFQGRVAVIPSMFWGFLSLLMFDFLLPAAKKIVGKIPEQHTAVITNILVVIFCIDLCYTVITIINFTKYMEKLYQLKKELETMLEESRLSAIEERWKGRFESVSAFLKKHPLTGTQRLLDAFPNMKILTEKTSPIKARELLAMLKDKTAEWKKNAKK